MPVDRFTHPRPPTPEELEQERAVGRINWPPLAAAAAIIAALALYLLT
jgi:hypothetical protein